MGWSTFFLKETRNSHYPLSGWCSKNHPFRPVEVQCRSSSLTPLMISPAHSHNGNDFYLDISCDGHVHTKLCNHARGEMEEYIQSAIQKKLKTIIFTEHLEAGISYYKRLWLTEKDFEIYFKEGKRLQQKYADKIEVKLGAEVGFNPQCIAELKAKIEQFSWDKIGLSYHFFPIKDNHYNIVSKRPYSLDALGNLGVAGVLTSYFDRLLQAVEEIDADVLCHLDAALRYHPDLKFQDSHWYQCEKILEVMAQKKVALEINTSGYAIRDEPFPSHNLIREAVKRNIRLAPGSDAHSPEQVGKFFSRLPEFVRKSL